MDIVICCGAMPFGAHTLRSQSLGGSETAALMLGKELAKRGHDVKMFCIQPPADREDAWTPGKADDGVTYVPLEMYQLYAPQANADMIIIVRDPGLAAMPALARKKVLWMHDVATVRGMKRAFEQMAWTVDEVWTVSEWHRQQVSTVTGYPADKIVALRNGIVPVETIESPRSKTQLIYAARPERGLENALEVMKHLPDYQLVVCMYAHFPEHMREFYEGLFRRMEAMPNVQFLGPKPQRELRQLISESVAYLYPTEFEETSCILARECIEQKTPFLTTQTGALLETLGRDGLFFEEWCHLFNSKALSFEKGSPEWCEAFAGFVRESLENEPLLTGVRNAMAARTDLYWDGVAAQVELLVPNTTKTYSRAWSLMQDGDVIAAHALLLHDNQDEPPETWSLGAGQLYYEIANNYPFLRDTTDPHYMSMADYYAWVYEHKEGREDSELVFRTDALNPRIQAVIDEVAKLPSGARILEYGCGPGHLLAALAKRFPDKTFYGVEISRAAVNCLNDGAQTEQLLNLEAHAGDLDNWPKTLNPHETYDAAIISEVLEHTLEPWDIAQQVEMSVKPEGRVIITTPFGSWEQATIRQPGKWAERAHIWHLDPIALREMFGHRKNVSLLAMPVGQDQYGRLVGNTLCAYDLDDQPVAPLDPLKKAWEHIPRETVCACVIAHNNEETILKMLNSIKDQVNYIFVALSVTTSDRTLELLYDWASKHPWVGLNVHMVPPIKPREFGFDDARNVSAPDFAISEFDWFLWIDTDEYLSGNFLPYLRRSAVQGYIVPQHHFTVEPRGMPVQVDRPARLLRTDAGYRARGHIHEHFVLPDNKVGYVWMLPGVDIGHVGYVNETVRRDRFARNFAFLEWDHEQAEPPLLHHFLWFRDIVHRVRLLIAEKQMDGARKLAREGLQYYNEHWKNMLAFGQGFTMSLQYVSELRNYLAEGVPIKIVMQIGEQQGGFEGRFTDYAEFERMMRQVAEDEMKGRLSRYY